MWLQEKRFVATPSAVCVDLREKRRRCKVSVGRPQFAVMTCGAQPCRELKRFWCACVDAYELEGLVTKKC